MTTSVSRSVKLSAGAAAPSRSTARRPVRQPRLARYRPVPPVAYDEEGYPYEDSAVETDWHALLLGYLHWALRTWFGPRAWVCSEIALLYGQGDPTAVLAPDLLVAFGPVSRQQPSYKLWEQPLPSLVMEVQSKSTSRNDRQDKMHTYATLGIKEYWLFDPRRKRLPPRLEGYRLQGKRYQPVPANAAGQMASCVLGLELRVLKEEGEATTPSGHTLRFYDPASAEFLRSHQEEHDDRLAERAGRQQAEAAQQQAEAAKQQAEERAAAAEAALRVAEERLAALRRAEPGTGTEGESA